MQMILNSVKLKNKIKLYQQNTFVLNQVKVFKSNHFAGYHFFQTF